MTWAPFISGTIVSPPTDWGTPGAMFSLAQELVQDSENFLQALQNQASQIFAPTITPQFPTVAAAPTAQLAPTPNLIDVTWTIPTQPAAFTGLLNVQGLLPGPYQGVAPTLSFGAAPAPFSGSAPTSPPIDLNFTYPTPNVTLPQPPSLLGLDTVTFNAPQIPSFGVTVPQLTAVAPSVIGYNEGPAFTSSLLTQLETDLQNALSEGTWTGLPPDIEANLWDRGREREYRQMADALADLERMETLGYAFPPGVYVDARIKMQTEMQNTTAGLSRDIMIKQAELTLDNIVKARENATALESKLIDYQNDVNQRAFESAKFLTEAAINLYNATVQAYTAQLRGYEVQATVYDTQIKGILAQVEVLKANIDFEQTKASINTALVEQYKAEVDASLATIQIYDLQVKIIETQANIEKIKVDAFGAQIQAYVGQINAYTAQVEGYKASVETQGVIESAYKTSVEAYSVEVEAGAKQVDALVAQYKGQIDAYTAQLEGFKAAVESMVGQARAASEYNEAQAQVYRAQSDALAAYNNTLTAQWQAVINEQEQVAQIGVAAAKANGDLYIAARGLSLDASKVGAQVNAQLGAAALGAIHWASNANWSASSSYQISNSSQNVGEFITNQTESV